MPLRTLLPKLVNLSPLLVFSGGSYYAYSNYWPRTMGEWLSKEGFQKIEDGQTNHFKAMFHDNKKHVEELGLGDLNASSEVNDDNISKIKGWCTDAWNKATWNDAESEKIKKFCVYKPKTFEGLIFGIGKHENFITEEDDYKTVHAVFKYIKDPSKLTLISEVNSSTDNDTGKAKVKKWCEDQLKKDIEDPKEEIKSKDFKSIFTWCTKLDYKTVKEKLEKSESGWTIITEDNDWKTAFGTWKNTSEVLAAIKKANENDASLTAETDDNTGKEKIKKWCEAGIKKNIYDEGVYQDEYQLIKSACKKTTK